MHNILEVIMPPTDDVPAAIDTIMKPFYEGDSDNVHAFWDFYKIGGRFAGGKIQASLGSRLNEFTAELKRRKVTVSGLQWGKQELDPASQIPEVDALWREWFPDSGIDVCPLFQHSNRQLDDNSWLPKDICTVAEVPETYKADRVIVAWDGHDGVSAQEMLCVDIWNGVSWQDTTFSGLVHDAIAHCDERLKNAKPEYREKALPQKDWLCVTVDYHS